MDPTKLSPDDEASARNRRALSSAKLESLPPAVYPGRIPLEGPRVALEALDPRRHASELFQIRTPEVVAFERYFRSAERTPELVTRALARCD